MNSRVRTILIVLIAVACSYIAIRQVLKYKLNDLLKEQEKYGIHIAHDHIYLNLLNGSASFKNPEVQITKQTNIGFVGDMTLKNFKINDIHYLEFLLTGNIDIKSVSLDKLQAAFKTALVDSIEIDDTTPRKKLGLAIILKDLVLTESNITVQDGQTDSLLLSLSNFNLDVSDIEVSDRTIANSIPFIGSDYLISSDTIFVKATKMEDLFIAKINGDHNYTSLSGITYKTGLSKTDFYASLTKEKDRYSISIDSLQFQNLGLQSGVGDQISVSAQKISLVHPSVSIYRNKLLPDDTREKPMYSQLLRNSPLQTQIDTFQLKKASFTYIEKSKPENAGGKLEFSDLNMDILNLGNSDTTSTTMHLTALFMKTAPFEADWKFNVSDPNDAFTYKGALRGLNLSELNKFTEPYSNTSLEGSIHELYFNIYGNSVTSKIDIKSNYENVNVYLLKPDTHKRKKIVSALVNILVSSSSSKRNNQFNSTTVEVRRDNSKSFWSYIVKNIEAGMKKLLL